MSDINFNGYGDEEFFTLFLEAVKETYGEYCAFKEREENLSGYSEPVFEKSIEEAEQRITSIVKIIPKVTNEAAQHKTTADYAKRHLEQCETALSNEQDKREVVEQQLAKANERVEGLELHANSIADALGFNAENNNRLATSVICTNIRNLHSFSDCLSRIENAFLMVESETDEFGETSEDVAFSKWGLTPHEYCIEFGKWLNKFAIEQQIEGIESSIAYAEGKSHFVDVSDLQDYIEQLRKEQE